MKRTKTGFAAAVFILLLLGSLHAQESAKGNARQFVYRQQNAPDYRVIYSRDGQGLMIAYRFGDQSRYQKDVSCRRDIATGSLDWCETFPPGGVRRYEFAPKAVRVTQPDGRASVHPLDAVAHPELLDAVCAFVATGGASQRVLYLSQDNDSFSTQGFVMSRGREEKATTPAGTFPCVQVKLALDFPIGLFFSLDFLVARDVEYPFVVKGRTTSGGDFQLVGIE
jgi:hypothetical protein